MLKNIVRLLPKKKLFIILKKKFGASLDLSLFTEEYLTEIDSFFESLSMSTNEEGKMVIIKVGLSFSCLLLRSYATEARGYEINNL